MPSARIEQAEMFEHALIPAESPRRNYIEHQIQSAFNAIVEMHVPRYPDLRFRFAYPAGEIRPRVQDPKTGKWYSPGGQRLKEEGMQADVPDYWFPIPRGPYLGWVCEFKAPGEYPRKGQRQWLKRMEIAGWQAHVHRDPIQAWESLKAYLLGISREETSLRQSG